MIPLLDLSQKIDSKGTLLWTKLIGGQIHSIFLTSNNIILIVGRAFSPDFPMANMSSSLLKDSDNAFISKLDENGNLFWTTSSADFPRTTKEIIGSGGSGDVFFSVLPAFEYHSVNITTKKVNKSNSLSLDSLTIYSTIVLILLAKKQKKRI